MISNIWDRVTNNATIMTWVNQFVNIGSALFILPLLLRKFDELEISFWLLINIFNQLSMLADTGFGPTIIRAVSFFKAGASELPTNKEDFNNLSVKKDRPNYNKLSDLLSTSNRIYLVISFLSVLLLSTLGLLITWNIFKLSGFRIDFIIAFCIVILNSYVALQTVKWIAFMTGLDYVAKTNSFSSIIGIIRVLVYVIILLIAPSVLNLMIFNFIATVVIYIYLKNFILKWFAKNKVQQNKRQYFDKKIFNAIWPATWKLGGIFWGNYLISYASSIIIVQTDNTSLMANYLFTQRVFLIIKRMSEAPFYANVQKTFKLLAQKKIRLFKLIVSEYIFLSLVISILSIFGIGLFGNMILILFDIDTQFLSGMIFIVMSLTLIFELHSGMHATIYTSTNQIPFLIPSIISGGIILSIGFFILPFYGLFGIILLQFLVQLSFNNWFSVYLSLNLTKWRFLSYSQDLFYNGNRFVVSKIKSILNYNNTNQV